MPRGLLPPVGGLLAPAAARPPRRWQGGLRDLNLPEGLLALAWSLAGTAAHLDPARRRDLALVLLAVLMAEAQGSTCLPEADGGAAEALARALGVERIPFGLLDDPDLAAFVAPDTGPLVRRDGRLSSRRLFRAESDLAQRLRDLAAAPPVAAVPEAGAAGPTPLSAEQGAAVALALTGRLALVTGGPGTGKTSILRAIVRGALQAGLAAADLALAAPTGKAAHRMAAALRPAPGEGAPAAPGPQPQTLHRLLGTHPDGDRFVHHRGNPLRAALVVVDEASMVDAVLLARLVDALPPEGRLVLVGDADQLPSVDAGTAFGDLVAALPERTARLTRSFRLDAGDPAGAAILEVAAAINRGEGEAVAGVVARAALAEVTGTGVEQLEAQGPELRAFLDQWLATEVEGRPGFHAALQAPFRRDAEGWDPADLPRLADLFQGLDRARILCPLREAPGLRGSEDINAYLHGRVQAARDPGARPGAFTLGEPVLMTRNDYARGIFNGDPGLLLWVARGPAAPRLEVVFQTPQGPAAFDPDPLRDHLELAYALTVHKAQGSEFDRVALVLPEVDTPLATREVLYTALTRARRGVTLLGGTEALARAAGRVMQRASRLRGLLGEAGA